MYICATKNATCCAAFEQLLQRALLTNKIQIIIVLIYCCGFYCVQR